MSVDPFAGDDTNDPCAFIQWKGTDVCMDVYCSCGEHLHYDGDFAYFVKCPKCEAIWQMGCMMAMRPVQDDDLKHATEYAKVLRADDDEDF